MLRHSRFLLLLLFLTVDRSHTRPLCGETPEMIWFSPPPAVHATMKSALSSLTSERERLRQCVDYETCPPTSPQVVGLKNTLATVCWTGRTIDV